LSAFPRPAYLDQVSSFIVNTTLADLTPGARDRGRWVIADSIPVIAAGMQTPELKAFAKLQLANAASGESWVLGTGRRAGALDAGLLNGTAGTCLELDEGNLMMGGRCAVTAC
jgi:2-methylcitrate dehydratase PrpD